MLDRSKVGHEFSAFTVDVEPGRLRFFAQAIGETNPIYTDESVAGAAGHPALPAPPTFMFSIDLDSPELLPVIGLLDLEIGRILHGSQEFDYLGQIYAGDSITQQGRIVDIYDKKGGELEFIVQENLYTNQNGELVGRARQTFVYRN